MNGIGIWIGKSRGASSDPLALYVSNSGGTGEGHNISDAITPSHLATLTLESGQKIYFNKGESYNSFTLDVDVDNVIIDSYGTGTNPIISGSTVIDSGEWTSLGGGKYSVAKAGLKWLYLDDAIVEVAKTNIIQISNAGAGSHLVVSEATKTYLDGFTDLTGSKLRLFESGLYRMSYEYTVQSYSSVNGTIVLDRDYVSLNAGLNNYFFIYNYSEFLANEKWCYDGSTLTMQTVNVISDHIIAYGTIDNGIYVTGNNCTIQNVTLKNYQKTAIKSYNNTVNINNCTIHDMRGTAIYCYGNSANPSVTDNTIYNIGNNGIWAGAVESADISGNTIHDICNGVDIGFPVTDAFLNVPGYAYLSNFGTTDDLIKICGSGITGRSDWTEDYALPDSMLIQDNIIYNVGFGAINVTGDNHTIRRNIVYDFGNVYSDLAGIYTYAGSSAVLRDASANNILIYENVVKSPLRVVKWAFINNNSEYTCGGIYLDNLSSGSSVYDNTIYGFNDEPTGLNTTTTGILLNEVSDIDIYGNTIEDYGLFGLFISDINTTNIRLHDNIFYYGGRVVTPFDIILSVYTEAFTGGGYSDYNTYICPINSAVLKLDGTAKQFTAWQTDSGQDANSINRIRYNRIYPFPTDEALLYVNETAVAVLTNITAGYKNLADTPITSITLDPFTSILVLKDRSISIFNDTFAGETIDTAKWTETDPNSVISQNGNIIFTLTHAADKAEFANKLVSVTQMTNALPANIYVAQANLTWTTDSASEAIAGLYLALADNSKYASITSRSTGGKFRLRVFGAAASQYSNNSAISKNTDVKIWTDGTSIKFYYWDGNAWQQMGATVTYTLNTDNLVVLLSCSDNVAFTGANPVNVDNVYFSTADYATQYPI